MLKPWSPEQQYVEAGMWEGQANCGCIKIQAEQVLGSMVIASWSLLLFYLQVPDLNFCPGILSQWMITSKVKKPFPLQITSGHGLYKNNRKQTKT